MIKHWEHTEMVDEVTYRKFLTHNLSVATSEYLPPNTAVYVQCLGLKRLEGVYSYQDKSIRPLKTSGPNRDLRLYLDALQCQDITILAVDGLMGTGKTSSCISAICEMYLGSESSKSDGFNPEYKVLIAKPHVNAGGSDETYGFLPGDINEKLEPTLINYIQYFDRFHYLGYNKLSELGLIRIQPLGYIRGLDAENMIVVADECQNTKELISFVTRRAKGSRMIILGDTSPFQIDKPGNTPTKNGLTDIIDLLSGAPYFQYIEMKSIENIVRSEEVRDIVRRLFIKYGKDPQNWSVN